MIREYKAVRDLANIVGGAIHKTNEALASGRIQQEPAFTDRMLGAIENALASQVVRGICWTAKTLTDRGPQAQEHRFGADFMGVFTLSLPNFEVSKGFLAQAKMAYALTPVGRSVLVRQCKTMLQFSAVSFVFVYGWSTVRVFPAVSVIAAGGDVAKPYSRDAVRFFEEHFECFIGDPYISSPSLETLEQLRVRYETRSAFMLRGASG